MLAEEGVETLMANCLSGDDAGPGFALVTVPVTMPADSNAVRRGLERALKSPPLRTLSQTDRDRVEVLLAEVLNNIIEHAFCGNQGEIRLFLRLERNRLCLVVEDEGKAMPGGELPAGALPDPDSLPEGGFGWFLIRALASEIAYLRKGKTNRLDIVMVCQQ